MFDMITPEARALEKALIEKELKRCIPCQHCGANPEAIGNRTIVCPNLRSCKGNTKTGYCGRVYISVANPELATITDARQRWNKQQKNSDIRALSKTSVKNKEDRLLAQVAASRAHATKLGKIAELRKEKIKILQEEISKLSSLTILEKEVVEKFRKIF